jgi:hypothetical protein
VGASYPGIASAPKAGRLNSLKACQLAAIPGREGCFTGETSPAASWVYTRLGAGVGRAENIAIHDAQREQSKKRQQHEDEGPGARLHEPGLADQFFV